MAIGTGAALLGAGLGGALISNSGARRAGDQIAGSADAATAEQRRQFDIATGLTRPSIEAGNTARDQLLRLLGLSPTSGGAPTGTGGFPTIDIPGDFARGGLPEGLLRRLRPNFGGPTGGNAQPVSSDPLDVIRNTPGFEFQLEQGTRALNANRSAGGVSGGELIKDFDRFNQGTASSFYQDYANRLANLAGTGQTAATQTAGLGVQTGANIGNSLISAGNARASGVVGQANSFSQLLRDLGTGAGAGLFDDLFSGPASSGARA